MVFVRRDGHGHTGFPTTWTKSVQRMRVLKEATPIMIIRLARTQASEGGIVVTPHSKVTYAWKILESRRVHQEAMYQVTCTWKILERRRGDALYEISMICGSGT